VGGGARDRQGDAREKYLRDVEALQQGLLKEPDNARYVFYLGQSWGNTGELEKALEAYDRRAAMDGCVQEGFRARLRAARLAEELKYPPAEVMDRYLRAYESRPSRAEAIGELARLCRVEGRRWPLAHMFARQAAQIPYPSDTVFIEPQWYEWRALDELAVSAYWVGEYEESMSCCERMLEGGKLPDEHRERVIKNLECAQHELGSRELVGA
jgi:tetratricopeptide (TPR) repeat protein